MRRDAKIDTNQPEIVLALRAVGASVFVLSGVGQGFPDLACGFRGQNYLLEVKPPAGPQGGTSRQGLTADERTFHMTWRGQRAIVTTTEQALYAIGATRRNAPTLSTLTQET